MHTRARMHMHAAHACSHTVTGQIVVDNAYTLKLICLINKYIIIMQCKLFLNLLQCDAFIDANTANVAAQCQDTSYLKMTANVDNR